MKTNNALLNQMQYRQTNPFPLTEKSLALNQKNYNNNNNNNNNNNINDDEIVLLLTAEQNLIKFLTWALSELYPYGKFSNVTENGAEAYHPGMYVWKKLNLSGRLEPPLLVQEPHYLIVRREYDQNQNDDGTDNKRGFNFGDDPFIPPRGRKHDLPDLDSLLQRYETFVPNRGRRYNIKDIFKYDDPFYPNRGKRQMITATNDNSDTYARIYDNEIEDFKENQKHYYNNEENSKQHEIQHPLLSNELMEYIENLMVKMKRKLHQPIQKLANIFDEKMSNKNEPTSRMSTITFQQTTPPSSPASVPALPSLLKKRLISTINILHNRKKQQRQHLPNHNNARRQWWKRYATAKTTSTTQLRYNNDRPMTAIRSPTMNTRRLQATLRSMSPLQQLTQLYQQQQQQPNLSPSHIRTNNKFMWQQQQKSLKSLAQQFDPLSWHKLQLLLQQYQQQQQQQILQQYQHRHHQPLLTMRHPRLTVLQHLPTIKQQQQQQQQQQQLQLATPQETQLTYSSDQLDNSISNDLDNL